MGMTMAEKGLARAAGFGSGKLRHNMDLRLFGLESGAGYPEFPPLAYPGSESSEELHQLTGEWGERRDPAIVPEAGEKKRGL